MILLLSMKKESNIFNYAGGFFLFLGAWWLADALMPEMKLFEGGWGIALRCVTGGALLVLAAAFVREYRQKKRDAATGKEKKPDK